MFVVFGYKVVFKMAVDKPLRVTSLRAFKVSQIIEFVSGKDIRSCLIQRQFIDFYRCSENKCTEIQNQREHIPCPVLDG